MKWGVLTPDTTYTIEADTFVTNGGALVFYNATVKGKSTIVRVFAPGAYLQAWPVEETSNGPSNS